MNISAGHTNIADKTNVKYTISYQLIFFVFLFMPVMVDQLNGFMEKELGVTFSISQIVKSVYTVGMLAFIILYSRSRSIKIFLFIFIIYLPVFLNALYHPERRSFLADDIVFLTKVLTFPISFYFFDVLFRKYNFIAGSLQRYTNYLFLIIFFAIILALLGYGKSNYGEVEEGGISYGYRGYFIAGNELSALFVVIYAYFCYYLYKRFSNILLLAGGLVAGMVISILIVSKTAMASFLIISIFTPFLIKYSEYGRLSSITRYDKKFLSIFILIPLVSSIFLYSLFQERIEANINRMSYNLEKAGELSSFLLSGRDKRINDSKELFADHYTVTDKLAGTGWKYPQHIIETQFLGLGTSELDYLDLLNSNGIIGVCTVYLFWLTILLKLISSFFRKNSHPLIAPAMFGYFLVFCLSFISGHIMYSAMLGFYLGYLLTPLHMKGDATNVTLN